MDDGIERPQAMPVRCRHLTQGLGLAVFDPAGARVVDAPGDRDGRRGDALHDGRAAEPEVLRRPGDGWRLGGDGTTPPQGKGQRTRLQPAATGERRHARSSRVMARMSLVVRQLGDAKWTARHHLDTHVDVAPGQGRFGHDLVVDQALDSGRRDVDADAIPATVGQRHSVARLVFRRIEAVEAREAHHRAAPAADDERAVIAADWYGDRAEEVGAVETHGLHLHAEAGARHLPRPDHAREVVAPFQPDGPLDDRHLAFATEGHRLPLAEGLVPSKSDTGAAASCALASVRSGLAASTPSACRRDSRGAVLFSARAILVEVEGRGTIASSLQEFTA